MLPLFIFICLLPLINSIESVVPDYKVQYNKLETEPFYHDFSQFESEMSKVINSNPHLIRPLPSPLPDSPIWTIKRNKIHAFEISFFQHHQNKSYHHDDSNNNANEILDKRPIILISFGEHARELFVLESAILFIKTIISTINHPHYCNTNFGQSLNYLLRSFRLHVIPLLNPDGKIKMEKSNNFCWRNNANSVDLNRNTNWQWGGPGSSHLKDNEEYRGESPFSENESKFIRDLSFKYNYTAFLSVHSGERQLFVPFVDTVSKNIQRTRQTTQKELKVLNKILKLSNGYFKHSGIGYTMNSYTADGTLYDYMAGERNIPFAFIAEIWGGPETQNCFVQFNPHPRDLSRELNKVHPFYYRLLLILAEELGHFIPNSWLNYLEINGTSGSLDSSEPSLDPSFSSSSSSSYPIDFELSMNSKVDPPDHRGLDHLYLQKLCEISHKLNFVPIL